MGTVGSVAYKGLRANCARTDERGHFSKQTLDPHPQGVAGGPIRVDRIAEILRSAHRIGDAPMQLHRRFETRGTALARPIAHRHDPVIYDRDHKAVATLSGDAAGAAGLEELVHRLGPPRTVWLMLPAGAFNARFRSRRDRTFAEKVLSAMRKGFGGHVEPGTARP